MVTDQELVVTGQELEIMGKFLLDHGIETDGRAGETNGALFGQVLNARKQRITELNLQAAFEVLKTSPRLVMANPVRAEYSRLASYFSEPERNQIATFLGQQGFAVEPEETLLRSWNIFARFLVDNKATSAKTGKIYSGQPLAVTPETLQYALRELQRSSQFKQLQWKSQPDPSKSVRKFDAEATAKAAGYELGEDGGYHRKTTKEPDTNELTVTHLDAWGRPAATPLSPELRAHQEQIRKAMEQAEQKKPQQPKETGAWEQMTLRRLEYDVRQVDRWLAEPIVRKAQSGEISWRKAYTDLDNLIATSGMPKELKKEQS